VNLFRGDAASTQMFVSTTKRKASSRDCSCFAGSPSSTAALWAC